MVNVLMTTFKWEIQFETYLKILTCSLQDVVQDYWMSWWDLIQSLDCDELCQYCYGVLHVQTALYVVHMGWSRSLQGHTGGCSFQKSVLVSSLRQTWHHKDCRCRHPIVLPVYHAFAVSISVPSHVGGCYHWIWEPWAGEQVYDQSLHCCVKSFRCCQEETRVDQVWVTLHESRDAPSLASWGGTLVKGVTLAAA